MLRKLLALSLAVAMVALTTGCPSKGKKTTTEAPTGTGSEKAKLQLAPPKDVTLQQGGEAKVTVEVTRTNFKEDVAVTFDLPKGVSVAGEEPVIGGEKDQAVFTLKAEADAEPVSKKDVKVTVTDKAGKLKLKTDNTFQITVEKKKK